MSGKRKRQMTRRHGRIGADRGEFLNKLAQEFKASSSSMEAKQQVLANLANFAYDPINHGWLWHLRIADLFFEAISMQDSLLQEFGMGGLANLCLDPRHHDYILEEPNRVRAISDCIQDSGSTHNAVLNAMITLMLIIDDTNQENIATDELRVRLKQLQGDTRKQAMATLFLNDYAKKG